MLFYKANEEVSENDTYIGLIALKSEILAPNGWAADGVYRSADGGYNCWVSLCTKVKYCKHVQCGVAGGEVQHPGLSVRDLEGVSVNLVDTVTRTQAGVACHTKILNIFTFRVFKMEFSPFLEFTSGK